MPTTSPTRAQGPRGAEEEARHPRPEVRQGPQEEGRRAAAARRLHARLHHHPEEAQLRAAQGRARAHHGLDRGHRLHPRRGPQPAGALRRARPRRPRQGPAGRPLQGRARDARRRRRQRPQEGALAVRRQEASSRDAAPRSRPDPPGRAGPDPPLEARPAGHQQGDARRQEVDRRAHRLRRARRSWPSAAARTRSRRSSSRSRR